MFSPGQRLMCPPAAELERLCDQTCQGDPPERIVVAPLLTWIADWRPTWHPGTVVRSCPAPRLSVMLPTGAAPQSVRTTPRTVPSGRFTLLTRVSSVRGVAGSLD